MAAVTITVTGPSGEPIVVTLDSATTTLAAAQANVLAAATKQCAERNADLKTIYMTAFNSWKISVDAGRINNQNPPRPPKGFKVTVGPDGWAYVEGSDVPVCALPPIPEDHSKSQTDILNEAAEGTIDIGGSADNGAGVWFVAGPHDRVKPGTVVTLPLGKFLRVGFPFGNGYYQKID